MLSLGHEACADRATAPMPHACRESHGGQLVTTRTCRLSDHLIKIFTFPYERRIGGRQGSLVGKEWMQTSQWCSGGGDVLSLSAESLCSDQITFSMRLPKMALAMTAQTKHAFCSLFARPTIGASHSMLPVPNTTLGYARCNAADACPTLVAP